VGIILETIFDYFALPAFFKARRVRRYERDYLLFQQGDEIVMDALVAIGRPASATEAKIHLRRSANTARIVTTSTEPGSSIDMKIPSVTSAVFYTSSNVGKNFRLDVEFENKLIVILFVREYLPVLRSIFATCSVPVTYR